MKALDPNDQVYLSIERPQQPMHMAALQLFSLPDGAGPEYVHDLAEHMREFRSPTAPFNKHLETRFGIDFWQEDAELDVELHLRHEGLPYPASVQELYSLLSAEHSTPLNRRRPLWEAHLIEGLSGRRFALFTKIHHALMDGISGMRLAMKTMSTDPDLRDMPPFWALPKRPKLRESDEATPAWYLKLAARHSATIPTLVREAARQSRKARLDPEAVGLYGAPPSMLNQRISSSRRFAAESHSLTRIRTLANAFDATVNDVVLAVCGSSLRAYLLSQDALPKRPLIAMVPMSIRKDDSAGGNLSAIILANLGTHLEDPVDRLRVIKASVHDAKARYAEMNAQEALNYSALVLAPSLYTMLTGHAPKWNSFNVVISNLPGPTETVYFNGARVEGIFPASLLIDHHALNVTLTSYVDELQFGIVGCGRTVPFMHRMVENLERGIVELERAADLRPPARDRPQRTPLYV